MPNTGLNRELRSVFKNEIVAVELMGPYLSKPATHELETWGAHQTVTAKAEIDKFVAAFKSSVRSSAVGGEPSHEEGMQDKIVFVYRFPNGQKEQYAVYLDMNYVLEDFGPDARAVIEKFRQRPKGSQY
jgi:hypothetical protein